MDDFENQGIPYDEIAKICAKMDMNEFEFKRRTEEAIVVFNNMGEFFQNESKQFYLTTVINENDMDSILAELEEIFVKIEDYEKCAEIKRWKGRIVESRKYNS